MHVIHTIELCFDMNRAEGKKKKNGTRDDATAVAWD